MSEPVYDQQDADNYYLATELRDLRNKLHAALASLKLSKMTATFTVEVAERNKIAAEALDYITGVLEEIDGSTYPDVKRNPNDGSEEPTPQAG